MDRLFFDTNVILDVLEKRAPWFPESLQCLALPRKGICQGAVTALTLSDIAYIQKVISTSLVYESFQRLRGFMDIADLHGDAVDHALHQQLHDVEDGFQLAAAVHWKATHLITRNVKDFPLDTPVKVLTPSQYLTERL
jgi:hypothetical protein